MDDPTPPSTKLCECGCGNPTPIAKTNQPKSGTKKGQPARFLRGHYVRLMWPKICKVSDCDGKHFSKGLCQKHYTRQLRHGNLTGLYPQGPAEERFWLRVERVEGCWNWKGARSDTGYGHLASDEGPEVLAHRFSYQLHGGVISEGMVVCHRCDNPACVNPDHLFLGSQRDNVHDMISKGRNVSGWAARTHCKNGHPFDEQNTVIRKDGARRCKTCSRHSAARQRAKRTEGMS